MLIWSWRKRKHLSAEIAVLISAAMPAWLALRRQSVTNEWTHAVPVEINWLHCLCSTSSNVGVLDIDRSLHAFPYNHEQLRILPFLSYSPQIRLREAVLTDKKLGSCLYGCKIIIVVVVIIISSNSSSIAAAPTGTSLSPRLNSKQGHVEHALKCANPRWLGQKWGYLFMVVGHPFGLKTMSRLASNHICTETGFLRSS